MLRSRRRDRVLLVMPCFRFVNSYLLSATINDEDGCVNDEGDDVRGVGGERVDFDLDACKEQRQAVILYDFL